MASPPNAAAAGAPIPRSTWPTKVALVTLLCAVLVIAAGPLVAHGLPYQLGMLIFAACALIAGVGGLVTLVMALRRRGPKTLMGIAAVAGLIALLVPAFVVGSARDKPAIHDITTDTANPPEFSALLAERADSPNPPSYDGPAVAAQQRVAYPDLVGVLLSDPPGTAFDKALAATRDMGWRIALADAAAGRIEAVATVPWWGTLDDVVIRVMPASGGSRVDVRSKSRVAGGDSGKNAERIRAYLAKLR